MPTRKAGLFLAFALWVLVLGLALGSPALILASVPVAMYLTFITVGPRPHLDVSVSRIPPQSQVYEREAATVSLKVRNEGPRIDLEVADEIPSGIEITRGSNHVFAVLERGEARTFSYTFSTRQFGVFTFGPIRVRSSDRSTSQYEEKSIDIYDRVRVYPEVKYLSHIELRHPHPRNWPGETLTRSAGQGLEFYAIREQAPGESVRRVNWKASARSGRLMLNQYVNEAGGESLVILDSRASSLIGSPPDTAHDYSVRAAAALCYRLLRDRNRVGLLNAGKYFVRVPPGYGRRQFEKILAGLVSTEVSEADWSLDLVSYHVSLFSRMVQVILVSPLVDWTPVYLASNLARRGHGVLVVSPSPVEIDEPKEGDKQTLRLAREIAALDRQQKLSLLRRHARVVDWNPRRPLEEALEGLKESWRVRSRI